MFWKSFQTAILSQEMSKLGPKEREKSCYFAMTREANIELRYNSEINPLNGIAIIIWNQKPP
jgi:hypothetical protein